VAYNGGGLDASISSSTPFTLNSGYFTSAWQNGLNITIQGYVGATPTSSVSFIVDTAAPVFETINLQNITSATFTSGISQFALDNLSVNAVPEPSTYALFGLGALVLVMAERRKRAA
jgi:hypothetical protein